MSQPNLAEQADEAAEVDVEPTLEEAQPEVQIPTQKRKTDVYTVMLIISCLCLIVACILLIAELNRWGTFPGRPWDTNEAKPNIQAFFDALPVEQTVV